ncbi:MAG: formate--tetrahydrofolate ligase [Alphaproteobacteria bacterium]|nr:formate--tetrahydrofolate ligase [Alphaproteobacteria bacterium]
MTALKSDIEIARSVTPQHIADVAAKLGLSGTQLKPFGYDKAKVDVSQLDLEGPSDGKLILVTAISPTPAGEGKTTTTVGLGDGLNYIGKQATICLREPSLGPCFGMKGGATGGGYAQVIPMEDINLHFTGDFHAITSAHNLLSALLDNHIYWHNDSGLDSRRVQWKRVLDMNDRSLRDCVISLGGVTNGFLRQTGFDITAASEVMAIFCLANSLEDLQERLAKITVGETCNRTPVTADAMKAEGPMTVLLKEALMPNFVQTLEHNPAFVHGGPFANIAHGCNTVLATKTALKLSDYVVTEAGFGSDLGAEKFFDIKCRKADLAPEAVVLVVTIRALKMHGGVVKSALGSENVEAIKRGCSNLGCHIENLRQYGVPLVVAINQFSADTAVEVQVVQEFCATQGVEAIEASHWANGGAGTEVLAHKVVDIIDRGEANFAPLYPDDMPLFEKISTIATKIYRAGRVMTSDKVMKQLALWEEQGHCSLPVCMAKTQYSFSTDPTLMGAPTGHDVNVREVRLSSGAGFVVAICGDIMTMPGLPQIPSAHNILLDDNGQVQGLF